jgi:hypothetical protein
MAALNPTGGKSRQKKKSAPAKPKRRAPKARIRKAPAVKKPTDVPEQSSAVMGRMERTRRLLMAALRVWELKRRPID